MGEVLLELEQVLRSKKLTSEEANVLMACKTDAIRGFTIGAGASGGVVWLATRRLGHILRTNIVGGIAIFSGLYNFGKALDSCVDHILNQKGSRMQQELANIMVRKYQDDQPMMQRISKHFYPENVFDDSSVDQPKLRWRYRNFFVEEGPQSEYKWDDSYNEKTDLKPEKNDVKSEPTYVNSEVEATLDPFDTVFGIPRTVDEVNHQASTVVPNRHSRSHKRSKRRQRILKREASLNAQHALANLNI
ncbi:uncharacterized protein LOC108195344 [Daucus carota subsp. sativus]|nr:PREDICTED: uncharacterized protein LOC108195344 [Daucus carota subsp. sativus]